MDNTNFLNCWNELRLNIDDWMARQDSTVITRYFSQVNWLDEENQRDFLKKLKSFDSDNGGVAWMTEFWRMMGEAGLFKDERFVLEYFKAIDPLTSVTVYPPAIPNLSKYLDKSFLSANRSDIGEQTVSILFRFW